jgi:hypothetical protein
MSFLIAIAVLVVTLLAAALIAPRPFHDGILRMDPCALEPREWRVIDSGCRDKDVGQPSWTRPTTNRSGEIHHSIVERRDRPFI